MPTYYTIVQCVPDPVANERINVGVIVYGDGQIRSRFVGNWQRVKSFGVEDVGFLRDFVRRIRAAEAGQATLPGVPGLKRFDEAGLQRIIGSWASGIQFSEPKGSLRPPNVVLDDAAARFLRKAAAPRRRHRGRDAAAAIARDTVAQRLTDRGGPEAVDHLLRRGPELPGRLEGHRLDVGVANARWHFALHGLSFELDDTDHLQLQFANVIYAVSDVRDRLRDVPIGLVVLPPRSDSSPVAIELFKRAERVFPRTGADLLTELSAGAWVSEQIDRLPPEDLVRRSQRTPQIDEEPPLFSLP